MTWCVKCNTCGAEKWEYISGMDEKLLLAWQQEHYYTCGHTGVFEWRNL